MVLYTYTDREILYFLLYYIYCMYSYTLYSYRQL